MTTHLEAQFPELTPFLDEPGRIRARAVLHREEIRVVAVGGELHGELIGAFYTADGEGMNRLRSWLRAHREVVLNASDCVGFHLPHMKER